MDPAIQGALAPLGYVEEDGKYSRTIAGLNLVESFQFIERVYWQDTTKHEVVKLHTGIYFSAWLPIRRTTPVEIEGTHWDGPVDQVVKGARTEWSIYDDRDISAI